MLMKRHMNGSEFGRGSSPVHGIVDEAVRLASTRISFHPVVDTAVVRTVESEAGAE